MGGEGWIFIRLLGPREGWAGTGLRARRGAGSAHGPSAPSCWTSASSSRRGDRREKEEQGGSKVTPPSAVPSPSVGTVWLLPSPCQCPASSLARQRTQRSSQPAGGQGKPCFPAFPPGKGHLGEAQPSPKDPPAASSCSCSIPGAGLCSPPPSCCSSRAETPPLPPPSRFFLADSWNFCSGSTVLL